MVVDVEASVLVVEVDAVVDFAIVLLVVGASVVVEHPWRLKD